MEILQLHRPSLVFTDFLAAVSIMTSRLGPEENTALLLLLKLFDWKRVLLAKALPSNGSGILTYLVAIA
jgi:hypothetical protein